MCPPDVEALGLQDLIVEHVGATAASMSPLARSGLLLGIDLSVLGGEEVEDGPVVPQVVAAVGGASGARRLGGASVVPSGYAWGLDGRLGPRPTRWPL